MCLGDGRGGQTRGQELSPLRCQVCDLSSRFMLKTLEKLNKELSAATEKYHDEEASKINFLCDFINQDVCDKTQKYMT